ncbi:HIT domain-containing protein [Streptomyces sp. SID1046]|uniref:HIT domain-containing protein n=1 Tax=Streptomyces sp. SID1046 TaxID=2690249 RepID=UPI00136A1B4A|nr:HIT domain-containing protein [Streptomyces sp. SID1046]
MTESCVFCQIVAGLTPATVVRDWPETIAITPLNPVVDGHTLVIPKTHVRDFTTGAYVSAMTMHRAAELAEDSGPMNLITSKGWQATQSVFHLHLHLVPRAENDGLALPWYSGRSRRPQPRPSSRRCSRRGGTSSPATPPRHPTSRPTPTCTRHGPSPATTDDPQAAARTAD